MQSALLRKTRLLTQVLILSGMLNIGFIATFIYVALQDRDRTLALPLQHPKEQSGVNSIALTNSSCLTAYSLLPFETLLSQLENKELLEEGLRKRDLALASLVAFHHFNIEKALLHLPLQKRSLSFTHEGGQEQIEIPIYPGLLDEHFQILMHFAKTEKWPLTTQGLFYELQRCAQPQDPSLIAAFSLSAEYTAVQTFFSKTGLNLSAPFLIALLCEGTWEMLHHFYEEQEQNLDFSVDARHAFILTYLDHGSPLSAKLLLQTDSEYVLRRCDDKQILSLLDHCDDQCSHFIWFAKSLLTSARADKIRKRAAERLYALAHEAPPEPYDHAVALARFIEAPVIPQKEGEPLAKIAKKTYIVEKGDNLWKISRKFHVSIEALMRLNHLETEKLRPGTQLEIPQDICKVERQNNDEMIQRLQR